MERCAFVSDYCYQIKVGNMMMKILSIKLLSYMKKVDFRICCHRLC